MNYTIVLGIDKKTIESLRLVWPTWKRFKPSLLERPFVIFYDGVSEREIYTVLGDGPAIRFVPWPPNGIEYPRSNATKWENPQRAKMLAGFVHVPATTVETPYWLKLDVDVVATGKDDWVDQTWFDGTPAIVAPGWNYTKPADQMLRLDEWAKKAKPWFFADTEPLDLRPSPGSDLVRHHRICSWCAFFHTQFTIECSQAANHSCGRGQIPVDSQDGYMWYVAERGRFPIRRVPMKQFGWRVRHNINAVRDTVNEVMV